MMRTANPAFANKVLTNPVALGGSTEVMTLEGTVNKTLISIGLTSLSAYFVFSNPAFSGFFIPAVIIALIVGLVISFKPTTAPYLTPAYAVCEGALLGTISLMFETAYPGIVVQAVSLTFGTLFALLLIYKSRVIPVTQNFKLGVAAATGGIFLLYLVSFVLSLFGVNVGIMHGNGMLSIGISVVVVVIAALNLVLDFDFIENAAARGESPKYLEWYGAFALLVTLVWLYMEILRLLSKLQSRD